MSASIASSIVLSGATGFLGSRLCGELLRGTDTRIHCLVRAESTAHAAERLHDALTGLVTVADLDRVVAVPADLDRPRLGSSPPDWDAVARAAGTIFHCAASINLGASYEQSAPTNIGGTNTILALARRRIELGLPAPRVHAASTIAVFARAAAAGMPEVNETSIPTAACAGTSGYLRTKTEAESILRTARSSGLDIVIHRPAIITGDWRTGTTSAEADLLHRFLRASIALRHYPSRDFRLPIETADTVARGMFLAARFGTATSYHHARDTLLDEAFNALRRTGHILTPVPRTHWYRLIQDNADDPAVYPAAVLARAAGAVDGASTSLPRFHSDATWAELRAAGLEPPPLDANYFDRWIAALTELGALPTGEFASA
ncbi:SDR family oxidoreductase [Nocardia sp. NBC_01503]|uniref:SDR family oxidoreductase n=1 Tax=Nocardia sp. NBC_01503 TaxID=2975997 RepID=UPI002E7AD7A6|nr:SDR family oxidoreductase [Nocardia sp. NBC_01503]WTL31315.1 SDR family oxidoreductase [Nocardia sp. NBC_01503]